MPPPVTDTRSDTSAFLLRHIDAWRAPGQNQQAFCKRHDLIYHRFTYWRRKLKDQAYQESPR